MLLICFIDNVIDDFMIYGCLYGIDVTVHDTDYDTVHDGVNVLMLYWNVFILFLLLLCLYMLF
jgi:hypothetical protein